MLQQALNKLEGKPVQESKSLSERRLAQNKPAAIGFGAGRRQAGAAGPRLGASAPRRLPAPTAGLGADS